MKRIGILLLTCMTFVKVGAQEQLAPLTVEKIMKDPVWMGSSPSSLNWNAEGNTLYFKWNPDGGLADSLYKIEAKNAIPVKVPVTEHHKIVYAGEAGYNSNYTRFVFERFGDIYLTEISSGKTTRVTNTIEEERRPFFSFDDNKIIFTKNSNLFSWDILTGAVEQLIDFVVGKAPVEKKETQQNLWLKRDQLQWLEILKERKQKQEGQKAYLQSVKPADTLAPVYLNDLKLRHTSINNDGQFILYALAKGSEEGHRTLVPNYVTESGYVENLYGRPKVGAQPDSLQLFVFNRHTQTAKEVAFTVLPDIKKLPEYLNDYPDKLAGFKKNDAVQPVRTIQVNWSPDGKYAMLTILSADNKNKWLALLDPVKATLKSLHHQRDEAWVAWNMQTGQWINNNEYWFTSEHTGYNHLYTVNVVNGNVKALSSGSYEVQQVQLSRSKKHFFITTNQIHPGEKQYYRLPVAGGSATRLTTEEGAYQVSLSPDEQLFASLYSYSNRPWELFLHKTTGAAKPQQITHKAQSDLFKTYAWRDPELVTIDARDGEKIYARLYKPSNEVDQKKPAVIFVHGAGYLQNAHKWWSSYFREYMFHNLLADNGYTVLDIDYRASAGYGRDWRTGIYRHMGGKDLTDHLDAVEYLVNTHGVQRDRIGMYGGSYGGFMTLMALFTSPGTFAAGAALRPVTDWAHYNQGYTSNILNAPHQDSIAYRKSSPIYFAENLQDHLLICHGVVDVNVQFQDVVRLAQRLIELGKDNWELAMYPVEDHGFVEPSSWTDEYKRIYKLFEQVLKK